MIKDWIYGEMKFWKSDDHEIDFVTELSCQFIEVKRGKVSPLEYTWFPRAFPGKRIALVNADHFETSFCDGITVKNFYWVNIEICY